jgi:hypothetical protein
LDEQAGLDRSRVTETTRRLTGDARTCAEVVARYETTLTFLWKHTAPLLGNAGASAVLGRAIKLAERQQPLAGRVALGARGPDLSSLRTHAADPACAPEEVAQALSSLCLEFFQTLYDLTGTPLTDSLLRQLEESAGP